MHGEELVDRTEGQNEIEFPRLDGALGSIALMAVRGDKLKVNGSEAEECF